MLRVVPFDESHVLGAAAVLASRHRDQLAWTPFLADPIDPAREVRRELAEGSGAAALDGDVVRGYLIGARREDAIGPYLWSYVAGHAVDEPSLVQELYAVAARRWVDEGLRRHFVFVPATSAQVEPWTRLSFGVSAALAAQWLDPGNEAATPGSIRRATAEDTQELAALDRVLDEQLAESPSFSGLPIPELAAAEEEWAGFESDRRFSCWVAEGDSGLVGYALLFRRPRDSLRIPRLNIDLATVVTSPQHRNAGIGSALTRTALSWAGTLGYRVVTTDWRMSNLTAARFWPARGFNEVFLRLYRSIP